MPHLSIEYSANATTAAQTNQLCRSLSEALAKTGLFPAAGIRVRAFAANSYAIADHHADNAFADLVLRIGVGRSSDEKMRVGEAIMDAAKRHFGDKLNSGHFALSLEIVEIDAKLSWKVNSMHARLKSPS